MILSRGEHRRRRPARGDRRRGGAQPARGERRAGQRAAARRAAGRGARAAAARVPRPHGARVHPHQARRERLEHLAHGARCSASSAPTCTRRCARSACRATARARPRARSDAVVNRDAAHHRRDARVLGGAARRVRRARPARPAGAADARDLPDRRALPPGARLAVLAVALAADRLRAAAAGRRPVHGGDRDLLRHASTCWRSPA